jgi:hypothetical protein
MNRQTISRSSLTSCLRAPALAVMTFALAFAALPDATAEAQTWAGPTTAPSLELARSRAANRDLQLTLSSEMERATRTVRVGGALTGLGGVIAIAGGALWMFPTCFDGCDGWFARAVTGLSLISVGGALATSGLIALGVGGRRRNRLRRALAGAGALAFRVGAGSMGLDLQF